MILQIYNMQLPALTRIATCIFNQQCWSRIFLFTYLRAAMASTKGQWNNCIGWILRVYETEVSCRISMLLMVPGLDDSGYIKSWISFKILLFILKIITISIYSSNEITSLLGQIITANIVWHLLTKIFASSLDIFET